METNVIRVRYWASARAAAGTDAEDVAVDGPVTLADLRARLAEAHPGTTLARVLDVCSVLLGDRPVKGQDPATVTVDPGTTVEFLPPFAGG
ncbi:MoaD/ThiS family protein [Nocardioides litoris]|uniref:MoaD/ThiS family protein n=1 Tax=Nocardioides litoris TaxID=1926648 RepID=UPI001121AD59|nr:MoaD/ThiS family protein [Nocardioides litoris]